MTTVEHPKAAGLIDRVRALLVQPAATWDVIAAEPATIKGLYGGYVAPLAAIGPVCRIIGQLAFGAKGDLNLVYRPPIARILLGGLVSWVMALVGVYLLALIIVVIAEQLGSRTTRIQAFKLAAYAGTAAWIAGVFLAFPPLAILTIAGLYSFWLLYVGLPKLMKVSGDKAMIFIICAIVSGLGVAFLVGIVRSFLPI